MGHGLLIMAAPCGQNIAVGIERLTKACHIAVTKDCPDTFDETRAIFGHLHRKPAHHRLGGGQADCGHFASPLAAFQ
jgi:hypothetical protein